MRRGEPAVLRERALLVPGSIPGWNDDDTTDSAPSFRGFAASGSGDERAWRVMLSSSAEKKRNRFYPLEHANGASLKESRNELGAPYRIRKPETSLTRLTARDFAQCASAWHARGAYFEDEIAAISQNDERFPNEGPAETGGRRRRARPFSTRSTGKRFETRSRFPKGSVLCARSC